MSARIGRRRRHRRHKARFRMHSMRVDGMLYTGDYLGTMTGRCAVREVERIKHLDLPPSVASMGEDMQEFRRRVWAMLTRSTEGVKP